MKEEEGLPYLARQTKKRGKVGSSDASKNQASLANLVFIQSFLNHADEYVPALAPRHRLHNLF
jgi:hypothetical protein